MWKQFVKTAIAAILNKQFVYVFVTDGVDVFTLLVKLLRPPMVSPASSCFLFSLFCIAAILNKQFVYVFVTDGMDVLCQGIQ